MINWSSAAGAAQAACNHSKARPPAAAVIYGPIAYELGIPCMVESDAISIIVNSSHICDSLQAWNRKTEHTACSSMIR
eukprot:423393-Pleurochrysis_carterae.AAC.1